MSSEEAEALTENLERKWNSKHRSDFMHRMEKKMSRKEKFAPHF